MGTHEIISSLHAITTHPLRESLHQEMHNRPFPVIESPVRVTHMAVQTGEHRRKEETELLAALAERYSVNGPVEGASCYYQNFGEFEVRWERHTEFSTYTFISQCEEGPAFDRPAIALIPASWLKKLPGEMVVGVHLRVDNMQPQPRSKDDLRHEFEGHRLLCSYTVDHLATIWTAFRLHSDNFGRMLVINQGLNPCQTGRLVQRLLEIETYRMMTLLALPLVRDLPPVITQMDHELAQIIEQISELNGVDDERGLLQELSELAAQVEKHRATTNYRIEASKAYGDLVLDRLSNLSDVEVDGVQSIPRFLIKRFTPALKTCQSIQNRLEDLSRRITRASDLLSARVDLTIKEQNQRLLASMNRRSQIQIRLQQTVEGLSIVAISYYIVDLLNIMLGAAKSQGLVVKTELLTGVSIPVVMVIVWALTQWVKKRINVQSKKADDYKT